MIVQRKVMGWMNEVGDTWIAPALELSGFSLDQVAYCT